MTRRVSDEMLDDTAIGLGAGHLVKRRKQREEAMKLLETGKSKTGSAFSEKKKEKYKYNSKNKKK